MTLSKLKRKARFQLSNNGANLAILYLVFLAFYILLFFFLRLNGVELSLIINGPIVLGFAIYFLGIARLEKEPRSKKEKEEKRKEKVKKGIFNLFGMEIKLGKKLNINLDTAHNPYRVSMKYVFFGFKYFINSAALYIWTAFLTLLFTFFLIVPGIIKMIDLSMSFFILADNPRMDIRKVVDLSKKMMKSHRKDFFILLLSFIGWILFSIATLSLGFIITIPYIATTCALFYDELKKESIKNGVIAEDEIETKRLWEYN
ncbi:MAG: DUF975 family protein [Bacteroidales bacterium]|nr:DUF975 family protein [Bacteroidales bacterium]